MTYYKSYIKMPFKKPPHLIMFDLMRAAIALGYVALGFFFAMTSRASLLLPAEIAPYFGGALIAYGLFRLFRAYKLWQAQPELATKDDDQT